MISHPWQGNVRELRNAIERAVLLSDDRKLQVKDFAHLTNGIRLKLHDEPKPDDIPFNIVRMDVNYGITTLRNIDKEYARKVLVKMGGNKTQTARLLGISRPKLDTLLKN